MLGTHLYRLPKESCRQQKWLLGIRRENYTPGKDARLCSKHFPPEDFDSTSLCYVRLRHGAVPSIFEAFPAHLQNKRNKRKPPTPRHINDAVPQEAAVSIPATPENPLEVKSSVSPSKGILKRKLEEREMQPVKSRKKIRLLQQKTRRLKKKNAEMCHVISALKDKKLISENSLSVLESCAGGVSDFVKRQITKNTGEPLPAHYSPALRSFALT